MGANGLLRFAHGPKPSRTNRLVAALLALIFFIIPVTAVAESADIKDDASAFIDHLGRRVISLLSQPKKAAKRKIRTFRRIFTDALEMDLMARQTLGRHWRSATKIQRAKYTQLFTEYVVQIYAAQFSNYSGESFEVLKEKASSGDDRVVRTRIIRDSGEITHVDFRVRKSHARSRFRVVDVAISGVSLLVAKRSEFDAIIRRHGLNGLISQLEQRIDNASASRDPVIQLAKDTLKRLGALVHFAAPAAAAP